jgi:carbonic anhydrase
MDGNQRFTRQKREYPHQDLKDLKAVATAQHPFVTLLSCADSRVPGEIVFDQGVGDVFDVRVAGNVVTPEVLGSVEYAAVLLKTPLIMVLGHERCGAVTAAVEGEALPGQIGAFVKAIQPALATIKYDSVDLAQRIDQAVSVNVKYQVEELKRNSSLLSQLVSEQKLKIVGGRYDLDTGSVTLIS